MDVSDDTAHAFEILVTTGYEPELVGDSASYRPSFLRSLEAEIRDAVGGEPTASQSGHGYGADGNAVAVVVAGLVAVFFSGKKINENLEAWLSLGKRLKSLLSSLDERIGTGRVSQPFAFALALEHLASAGNKLDGATLLATAETRVRNLSLSETLLPTFRSFPDRYYVFTIQIADQVAHVIGISSTGAILFHHRLELHWWAFPSGQSQA
ncbi:MAG: hypothetical protein JWL95_3038 [Gemmatimonadetes bacterium]|nr:hypothetical protein [Gemmatimonadota bacterium]